ncbi:MAG: sialate O-acetylesterase [Pseudoxanthomonas sp.]
MKELFSSRATAALALIVLACAVFSANAQVQAPLLHAMFQDHAVLQRDQPIAVWGHAKPGEQVRVALAGKKARASANAEGYWEARLPALKAGGPYTLSATAGGLTQSVAGVLVGDVWLCSGQSNMELQVWRALDAWAEIEAAHADTIRLLTVPQTGSVVPLETFQTPTQWKKVDSGTLRDFSAACFYFARELQKTVDVPMGLVNSAWGGSRIEAWTSSQTLRARGGYDGELDVLEKYATDPAEATAQWGELWGRWWRKRAGTKTGDEPWSPAYSTGSEWRDAPRELGAWERWGVRELADYNGMVWFRTKVRLSAQQAAQKAVLLLGAIDETDMAWVNGRGVGSTYAPGTGREYPLPENLLHEGENVVVVNALDTYRDGGMNGPASAYALKLEDGSRVALDGGWKYRMAPGPDSPPRAPWETAGGLSTLYNGMIAPLGSYGFRGALWYQGESNTAQGLGYRTVLQNLRSDWRARFGADLPLLIVQLAGYGMPNIAPVESDWAALREAQRRTALEDPRTGLAVAIDIGDRYDLHPPNKQELGRRLARAARHVVYGEKLPASGPVPLSARREGDSVVVSFGDVSGRLVAYGGVAPVGFELCGAAPGSCRYANAEIRGNEVFLRATVAPAIARVRYGWADSPVVTLFDGAGLPAGPFEIPVP